MSDTEHSRSVAAALPVPGKVRKIIRRKRRPARPQVDPATFKNEPPPQTGVTFNIWYNKWSGGDRESGQASQTHAKGRCNIAADSGYTRADANPGSYFCLFFARGLCPKGSDCEYLHRLPTVTDIFNSIVDCFGRDRFSDYRDDMGGVGSFQRPNRTLYVGHITATEDTAEIVSRHFAEWGQVERIYVPNDRGIAFVTYINEANAQFAKEAMAHQSLDHEEVLNVRWANDDPNPMAKAREARRVEEQAAAAIRHALNMDSDKPVARKRRRVEDGFGLNGYDVPDNVQHDTQPHADPDLQSGVNGGHTMNDENAVKAIENSLQGAAGVLPSSTLAALQRHGKAGGPVFQAAKPVKKQAGALVSYDSDSDD